MIELHETVSIIENEKNTKCIGGLETENYYVFQLNTNKLNTIKYGVKI